jgi:cellulose synthase/poly-beta-1,6-N-acetylglucosamine synthase-like glycosyltransferase
MDVKSLFEEKSLFEILDIINDMKKYNHSQTSRQNLKLFGDENDDFINDIRKLRNDLCHNKYFLPRLTAEISKNPIFSTGNKELLEKCQNFHVDLSNRLDLFNSPNVIDKLYILIPFYSNESTIIRTLESIYNCEFKNTAKTLNYKKLLDKTYIIFCDNNSKDKTRNIIGDFYKKNKQYSTKYDIIDEPRQGIQYAREKLIKILLKECKNDNAYCCFIDADDEFNNGGLYDLVKEGLMIKDVKYDIIRGNVMQIMCGDKGKNHKEIRRYRRHEKYALVNFFARTI